MKSFIVLILALAFAISPFLGPEFGGFDPNRYPIPQNNPPVQPIGWAFSIWGIIYLWLIVHAGYGVWRHREDAAWDRGRAALIVSLGVGSVWLPVALVSPVWATVMIWIMLAATVISLLQTKSASPTWAASWPIALYGGWLTAASCVSVGLLGAGYGIVFAEFGWAIIALIMAALIALTVQSRIKHWTYAAGVIWGLFGIMMQNLGSETLITVLAGVAALLIAGVTVRQNTQR